MQSDGDVKPRAVDVDVVAKTVLITGCSTGIGRATAEAFLDDGWAVYATARDADDLAGLADRGAATADLDVTRPGDVEAVVDRVVAERGRIDCLVNNAGYGQFGAVEDVSTDALASQFDVNVFGPHRLVRAVLPGMRERGGGTIVNVASVEDRLPLPGVGAYAASKFALRAISDSLRQELAGSGVDVAVVEPGLVATDFYDRALAELPEERSPAHDDLYRLLEAIDLLDEPGRFVASPRRIAETVRAAATASDPDAYHRVAPFSRLGAEIGAVLTGERRDRATRLGIEALSREWLLDRVRSRRETASGASGTADAPSASSAGVADE